MERVAFRQSPVSVCGSLALALGEGEGEEVFTGLLATVAAHQLGPTSSTAADLETVL